jgi:hypothetical protein
MRGSIVLSKRVSLSEGDFEECPCKKEYCKSESGKMEIGRSCLECRAQVVEKAGPGVRK